MGPKRILVIEPEGAVLRLIEILLSDHYEVVYPDPGEQPTSSGKDIDLVLFDIGPPPYEEGVGMLSRFRASSAAPIIAMTASSDDAVRHAMLESGVDDLLTLPFDPDQLLSHVRFLLGEQDEVDTSQSLLTTDRIEVDFALRSVRVNADPVRLSHSEWVLLESLASPPGQPRMTAELLTRAWGVGVKHDYQFLKAWIQRLQRKLGCDPANPRFIRPYHDVGYVLSP